MLGTSIRSDRDFLAGRRQDRGGAVASVDGIPSDRQESG
jgi:hypothetical protein